MSLREKSEEILEFFKKEKAVLKYKNEKIDEEINTIEDQNVELVHNVEIMSMATTFLQNLIEVVSIKNIKRINELVNTALDTIFHDIDIQFQIEQGVKRDKNVYEFKLSKLDIVGDKNSFGGGIVSLVSFILKIVFNIFSRSYPLIVLDESLSFVSKKYISPACKFINDLAKEFKIIILLVTHQPLFLDKAGKKYEVVLGKLSLSEVVEI